MHNHDANVYGKQDTQYNRYTYEFMKLGKDLQATFSICTMEVLVTWWACSNTDSPIAGHFDIHTLRTLFPASGTVVRARKPDD